MARSRPITAIMAGSENFGYLQQIHLADTEEEAYEQGKAALFGGGGANFSRPEWTLPPGYNSKEANRRLFQSASDYGFLGITSDTLNRSREELPPDERAKRRAERRQSDTRHRLQRGEISIEEAKAKILANYDKVQAGMQIIIGTPKSVIPKLRLIMQVLRPGVFGLFQAQGPLTREQRLNSMRLMGRRCCRKCARSPRNSASSIRSNASPARVRSPAEQVTIRWSTSKRSSARPNATSRCGFKRSVISMEPGCPAPAGQPWAVRERTYRT